MANISSAGILGDSRSNDGLFKGLPIDAFSELNSNFKVWHEGFKDDVVNTAQLVLLGWKETAVGTAASRTHAVTKETGYLVINADTVADEGTNIQHNLALVGTRLAKPHESCGPLTSTATFMDGRELVFHTRIRPVIADVTDTWTSKFALGWFVADTAIMAPATGLMTVEDGGGIGFQVGEDGILNTFYQSTTKAVGGTLTATGISFAKNGSHDLATAGTPSAWIDLGFRARWTDASVPTGSCEWFVNGQSVQQTNNINPMQSTQTYSVTYEVINGAATANQLDLHVADLLTGVTRPGGIMVAP